MMPVVLKAISIIFLLVFLLSVALLVLTFRRPRKVSPLSLVLVVVVALITLVVFSVIVRYEPSWFVLIVMGAAGLFIGGAWSRATRVYVENGRVMSRNSTWYLIVWGGVFALTQIISVATNRPPSVVMALLVMSTASVIGMNGMVMKRYMAARAGVKEPVHPPAGGCPKCGARPRPGDRFCDHCGERL